MVNTEEIQSLVSELKTVMVEKIIVLKSADGNTFEVNNAVALQMGLVEDKIRNSIENEPPFILPGMTKETLGKVIDYCKHHAEPHIPTKIKSFDAEFLKQVGPVDLFNLIQAAHHVKIKSLMDLTCQTLGNMVKTKTFGQIMQEFKIDQNVHSFGKHIKSPPTGLVNAFEGSTESPKLERILRHRGKETFVKKADFVDVEFSHFVTDCLRLVDRRDKLFDNYVQGLLRSTDLQEESDFTDKLLVLLEGGVRGHLDSVAVRRLLEILNNNNKKEIQCEAVNILSRAKSDECKDVIKDDAIPALVKNMSNSFYQLAVMSVVGLMRLADAFPVCINVILENDALEKALEIIKGPRDLHMIILCLAKFLAVVCRYGVPPDKVELARNISEEILKKKLRTYRHILFACHALQYLTYEHDVAIGEKTLHKLTEFIFDFSCTKNAPVAGSALAVVGNIARCGKTDQIQRLFLDCNLPLCLRKIMTRCKNKKLLMETCQIVSNIAAWSQALFKDMDDEIDFVESLCRLLEKDESGVKMEAAWAIYNCIYGNRERHIDDYSGAGVLI